MDTNFKWYEVCQEIDCELVRIDYIPARSKQEAIQKYMMLHPIDECDKIAVCEVETRRVPNGYEII